MPGSSASAPVKTAGRLRHFRPDYRKPALTEIAFPVQENASILAYESRQPNVSDFIAVVKNGITVSVSQKFSHITEIFIDVNKSVFYAVPVKI